MNKSFLFLSVLLFLIISSLIVLIFIFLMFKIKNIEIDKNIQISRNNLLKDLKITNKTNIFFYNLDIVKEKMNTNKIYALIDVKKKYPGTLVIKFSKGEPVAFIADQANDVNMIEANGIVFVNQKIDFDMPVIRVPGRTIDHLNVFMIDKSIREAVKTLTILKQKNLPVYRSISEIIITDDVLYNYIVKYHGNTNEISLKNQINTDLLNEGYVISLFFTENNINNRSIIDTNIGFAY